MCLGILIQYDSLAGHARGIFTLLFSKTQTLLGFLIAAELNPEAIGLALYKVLSMWLAPYTDTSTVTVGTYFGSKTTGHKVGSNFNSGSISCIICLKQQHILYNLLLYYSSWTQSSKS